MERQVVVGAAIVRDGRVLAARRTAPASAAGRWEFPGGKVEPGETDAASLVREVDEELGVRIRVDRWLAGAQPIGERLPAAGRPGLARGRASRRPTEHDEVRWLAADELDDVDWLDARPTLPDRAVPPAP